jgi:hypothetical protein
MAANKNAKKLDENAMNAKKIIEEGRTILKRLVKNKHFIFVILYLLYETYIKLHTYITYIIKIK